MVKHGSGDSRLGRCGVVGQGRLGHALVRSLPWLEGPFGRGFDGRGFDTTGRRGVGLNEVVIAAMEEIGGKVDITSAPGQGTLVEISGDYQWAMNLAPASSSSTTIP